MFGVSMERLYNFGLSTGKFPGRSGTLNSYKGVPFSLWKFYLMEKICFSLEIRAVTVSKIL